MVVVFIVDLPQLRELKIGVAATRSRCFLFAESVHIESRRGGEKRRSDLPRLERLTLGSDCFNHVTTETVLANLPALQSLTLGDGACEGETTSRVELRGLKELTTMRVGKRVWGLASEMDVSGRRRTWRRL